MTENDRLTLILAMVALTAMCAMVVAVFIAAAMWHLMRWLRTVTGDGHVPGPPSRPGPP